MLPAWFVRRRCELKWLSAVISEQVSGDCRGSSGDGPAAGATARRVDGVFCATTGARVSPSPSGRSHEIGAAIDGYVAERQYGATRAILVSYRGRLIAERYYDSHADDHAEVRSVTKSVMATLVGAALREGRLPSTDAKLGELLPQYRSIMDARTERITVRQLLTQTAGYTDKQVNETVPDRPTVPQLLKPGPQNPPGAGFEYQDGGPHLLSAVIATATGQTTLDYARRVLFKPLDIQTRPAYQGSLFDVNDPKVEKMYLRSSRAGGTRTHDRRIMSPLL